MVQESSAFGACELLSVLGAGCRMLRSRDFERAGCLRILGSWICPKIARFDANSWILSSDQAFGIGRAGHELRN